MPSMSFLWSFSSRDGEVIRETDLTRVAAQEEQGKAVERADKATFERVRRRESPRARAISRAALFVNVTASTSCGRHRPFASRYAIRYVRTLVFPEPAPATTRSGPPRVSPPDAARRRVCRVTPRPSRHLNTRPLRREAILLPSLALPGAPGEDPLSRARGNDAGPVALPNEPRQHGRLPLGVR